MKRLEIPNLEELEQCGFVRKYSVLGKKNKGAVFQLIDSYTLFHFKVLAAAEGKGEHFLTSSADSRFVGTWEGLAFERVCLLHVPQIKFALGISGVSSNVYSWYAKNDDVLGSGTQIDMLIDRADNTINVCEMKFYNSEFVINKEYDTNLRNKLSRFQLETNTPKTLRLVLITALGLKKNIYSNIVQNTLTLNDLFKDL